ncbi:MAG: SdrD B-like domain-containing protein [Chitinophagales bacterium]
MSRILFLFSSIICLTYTTISAQVSGTVFKDFNANGIKDNAASFNEVGIAGITINAYGASGTVYGPATTASDGTYTIAGVAEAARVEFTWSETWLYPTVSGKTTIQFVGGSATDIDLGLVSLDDHWDNTNQSIPKIFVPCYADGNAVIGPNIADAAVVTFDNNATGLSITKHEVATHEEVGALYGVAYDKSYARIFSAAFLKRHVGLGPEGIGGVYIFEDSGLGMDLTASFSLQGVVPDNTATAIDLGSITRVDSPGGNDNYLGTSAASRDIEAYGKVGKVAYGDIDISPDGKLYLVNLNQRTIVVVDIAGSTTASLDNANAATLGPLTNTYNLSDLGGLPTCTNGEFRPFGLKIYNGTGYLGLVCDGQDDNKFTNSNLEAFVLSFDPNNISAGFQTEVHFDNFDYRSGQKNWKRWANTWADSNLQTVGSGSYTNAQPILSDIEFTENGDMVVGFIDRFGHQVGSTNYEPTSGTSSFIEGVAYGEILHICRNGSAWEIEGTGACGTNFTSANHLLNDYSGNDPNDISGTGNGEYYDDAQGDLNATASGEASNGAMAKLMGTNLVLSTVMDPFPQMANGDASTYGSSGGVHWFNHSSGSWDNHVRIYENNSAGFRKSHGLGDLEALINPPHIEIGNLVWADTNGNGIQDANENGISDVSIELWNDVATLVATAVTDANGNYIFSNEPNATTTVNFIYNLNLTYGANYTLRIPNAEGGSQQGVLNTYEISTQDADATANGDMRDSDGSDADNSEVTFVLGKAGENNHTYDFGFKSAAASCSITVNSATPSVCNASDNTYSLDVVVSYANVSGDININSASFTPDGSGNETFTITGLTADGSTGNSVIANSVSDSGCEDAVGVTYDAPESCTSTSACEITNIFPAFPIDFLNNDQGWIDYSIDNSLSFVNNGDGTMTITGNIIDGETIDFGSGISPSSNVCGGDDSWALSLTLSDKQTWATWNGSGGTSNISGSCGPTVEQDIDYWNVTGTLTGTGCRTGETITINGPSDPQYRFQIGIGGNRGSSDCSLFGLSTWFDADWNDGSTTTAVKSDIYGFVDESCYQTPPACSIAVDSATPSVCNASDNTYSLDVVVSYANVSGDINVNGTTFTPSGTSPETFTITGLTADGSTGNSVVANSVSDSGCEDAVGVTYDAPESCGSVPCPPTKCVDISVTKN